MQNVNLSIKFSCNLLRETTRVRLLQLYLPNLSGIVGIYNSKHLEASTFHILVEKYKVLKNFTGRSQDSSRHCFVLVDAIAFQLVRNGR